MHILMAIVKVRMNNYERYYGPSKGVHATVVTAGHCTHADLTSEHALAIALTAVACTALPQSVLIN